MCDTSATTMVHSEEVSPQQMFYNITNTHTNNSGLPKSPSFHSGLDLAAAAASSPVIRRHSRNSDREELMLMTSTASAKASPEDVGVLIYTNPKGNNGTVPRQLPALIGR